MIFHTLAFNYLIYFTNQALLIRCTQIELWILMFFHSRWEKIVSIVKHVWRVEKKPLSSSFLTMADFIISGKQGFCLRDKSLCISLISYEFRIKNGSLCLPDKGRELYYSKDVNSMTLEDALERLRYPITLVYLHYLNVWYVFFSFSIHFYSFLLSTSWQGNHPKDGQPVIIKIARVGFTFRYRCTIATVPKVFLFVSSHFRGCLLSNSLGWLTLNLKRKQYLVLFSSN